MMRLSFKILVLVSCQVVIGADVGSQASVKSIITMQMKYHVSDGQARDCKISELLGTYKQVHNGSSFERPEQRIVIAISAPTEECRQAREAVTQLLEDDASRQRLNLFLKGLAERVPTLKSALHKGFDEWNEARRTSVNPSQRENPIET